MGRMNVMGRMNIMGNLVVFGVAFIGLMSVAVSDNEPHSACPIVEEEIIDLEILAGSLRETKALGALTKLRLKSDINKFLRRIDAWHAGNRKYSLDQLQEQYDLLLMKMATVLQDRDLELHQHLCNAWTVIWTDLQDPQRVREMRHRA